MGSLLINGDLELPRACDRCHAIKERCEWIPQERQCERCVRLHHVCQTNRPTGRPGRRPGRRRADLRSAGDSRFDELRPPCARYRHRMRSSGQVATVPRNPSELAGIPGIEPQFLQRILFQSGLLEKFSVGTSFCETTRQKIMPQLLLSRTILQDGLLACTISWAGNVDSRADSSRLSSCYRHASSALVTLASLQVTNSDTMADCLMLGALITTFAVRLRVNDILPICARTLGLIAPVYATSEPAAHSKLLVFLSCMVMWEIGGCLFGCAVPSLRFKPPTEIYVDRHAGLCATLLPLFHDLCKINHALAHGDGEDKNAMQALDALERSAKHWRPVVPEGFTERIPATEVAHMLCQAQVMRLAAMLVAHRLRFPFGVNDAPAQALSMTILTQLELTLTITKQPVRCSTIALLVACIELKEDGRRKWLPEVAMFAGYSAQFGKHVESTLTSFWTLIDMCGVISWQDLTSLGSPFLRHQLFSENIAVL